MPFCKPLRFASINSCTILEKLNATVLPLMYISITSWRPLVSAQDWYPPLWWHLLEPLVNTLRLELKRSVWHFGLATAHWFEVSHLVENRALTQHGPL